MDFTRKARANLDSGWTYGELNVCPLIRASLEKLGQVKPITRPTWLCTMEQPSNSLVEPDKETVPSASNVKVEHEATTASATSSNIEDPVVIACPGLRSTKIEGVEPHFSILNPEGLTTYGPTGKRVESFRLKYQMPFFPVPTLHGLMMVFSTKSAIGLWNSIDQHDLSRKMVEPLPSWWHLPSDAVTTSLALVLLLYGQDPCWSIAKLLRPKLENRDPLPITAGTPVKLYGFSAGSYSGMLAYRLLIEREHLLKCRFEAGILGAVCFHPIMLYDFFLRANSSPFRAADQGMDYRTSQGTPIKRPTLVHCIDDAYCLWKPSTEEADGVRQLGFPVKLISLNKHLKSTSLPFGKFHHNYGQLLVPILDKTTDEAFTNLGLPQLLALANFSSDGDQFFGLILSFIGVINLSRFGNLLLKLASNDPSHLLKEQPQINADDTATHLLRSVPEIAKISPQEISPCQLFWSLMLQEVADEPPLASALEKLRPFLEVDPQTG